MHALYRYIQMCYPNHLFHLYFEFVIIYLYIQRKRDADDHVSEQIAQINFQLFLTSSLTYAVMQSVVQLDILELLNLDMSVLCKTLAQYICVCSKMLFCFV